MTRSRFDAFFPAFRAASLAGLTLALLAGCGAEQTDAEMFGPTEPSEIDVTASLFGPIAFAEIEITQAVYEADDSRRDGYAGTDVPTEDPSRAAAAAWLEGMAAAAKSVIATAPVQVATAESYGASGGGVGIANTSFAETPPTSFAPRRKNIVTRGPTGSVESGLASMATTSAPRASAVTRTVTRSQAAVEKAPEPLTPEVIKTTIGRQMGKVRACYERSLKTEQKLGGKLLMGWKIGRDGKVKSVSVLDDELGSDKVSMCVVHAVATFKFPRGTETLSIEYPMKFKAGPSW
jgi:hypothetical protein